jgi:CubicO group peptidase (beta-lactamase class C family)
MKRVRLVSAGVLLALGLLGSGRFARTGGAEGAGFEKVTRLMGDVQQRLQLRGAAVLVGRADGTILYRRFFGDFTPATVVGVASVTKWWTAAVLESLAGKGLVDLDRPITAYLRGVPPEKSRITIRHLLSHTSGIPKAGSPPYKTCATLGESSRFLLQLPSLGPPGTVFQYNGSGMQIAGHIAEEVSGKVWADLFTEALGAPLDLHATSYGATRNPILGGGISTTLDELGRFLFMLAAGGVYRGKVVLTPACLRAMEQNVAGRARSFRSVTDGPLVFAGYNSGNWCEAEEPSGRCTLMSSYGSGGTYPWLDRGRGIYGVFLVDDSLPRDEPYFKSVRELVERIVDESRHP